MFSSFGRFAAVSVLIGCVGLAGCGQAPTEAPQAAAPTPTPGPKSATPNSFDEVTAQLDPGGDFYLYLSTEQWLSKLDEGINGLHDTVMSTGPVANADAEDQDKAEKGFVAFKDAVKKSGLEDISGIGVSAFATAPGIHRTKFFVHHYPDKGSGLIWSLQGGEPHALTGLDFLPADTGWGSVGDFDLARLINFLRQEATQSGIPEAQQAVTQWQTQFAGITGLQLDDVLASLSGTMGLVVTLDATNTVTVPIQNQPQTIPAPRLAILLGVKNDLIFKQVDKMAGGNPGVIKVDEPDLKMRTMPLPMIPGVDLRPTVAQWNGFLVIASDDKLVRDMVAVLKGAPGYKSTPEYAELSEGLPQQGNTVCVMSRRFSDAMNQLQKNMFANKPGMSPAQAAMMQQWMAKFRRSADALAVGMNLPNGRLVVTQYSRAAK